VASYLALDLGVDWRRGAALFEELLLDYDVASNWGNWVSAAGQTGGRINHFNITKQSKVRGASAGLFGGWPARPACARCFSEDPRAGVATLASP
jgi:deoxyribodipyrimidine photo-lyase